MSSVFNKYIIFWLKNTEKHRKLHKNDNNSMIETKTDKIIFSFQKDCHWKQLVNLGLNS